jgi:3-hydroxyisobutyrate dehydrogenase and related beta-hydroxyacid dehydrogenases
MRLTFDSQTQQNDQIGFIGLGVMGQPMALNMTKAGTKLIVWNRSIERTEALREAGAVVASNIEEVFSHARIVIMMMLNETVLDATLKRGTSDFQKLVAGHILISMGSNAPDYSQKLSDEIVQAGGQYVEAPVSGSRKPAEAGQLVSMISGDPSVIAEIRPLLAPLCRETVVCGPIGNALLMKLAVNLYLNTMLVGLAEAVHFADAHGLDLTTFKAAIDSGPMSCDVTRVKIPKLILRDFSVQAATSDAFNSTRLIATAARIAGIATPLLDLSSELYRESVALGNERLDMVSVLESIEQRTKVSTECIKET